MKNEKSASQTVSAEAGPTRPTQYLYANLVWYAFLALVSLMTFFTTGRVWDDVLVDAIRFLFLILGGGFTFATVLDFLYERYYDTKGVGEKP